jgi:hypothetical protein
MLECGGPGKLGSNRRKTKINLLHWEKPATSLQPIPQYIEVSPNIEDKRIISCFSAVLPVRLIDCF